MHDLEISLACSSHSIKYTVKLDNNGRSAGISRLGLDNNLIHLQERRAKKK